MVVAFMALFASTGCSSDAVPAPEPTLRTPGSFVAQETEPGDVRLFRVLGALKLETGQTYLIMRLFSPHASDFDGARELAKQDELPIEMALTSSVEAEFVTLPYRVVWFRTLTEQERDAIH